MNETSHHFGGQESPPLDSRSPLRKSHYGRVSAQPLGPPAPGTSKLASRHEARGPEQGIVALCSYSPRPFNLPLELCISGMVAQLRSTTVPGSSNVNPNFSIHVWLMISLSLFLDSSTRGCSWRSRAVSSDSMMREESLWPEIRCD